MILNSHGKPSLRVLETKRKVLKGELLDAEAWSRSVGTSLWEALEMRFLPAVPDAAGWTVNLWVDLGEAGQVWLPLGSGSLLHIHAFSFFCPGEDSSDLIRHFLIESSAKGVHLKGADEEPYFGEPAGPGWAGAVWARGMVRRGSCHCTVSPQGASPPLCASIPSWPWPCPANSPSRRKVGLASKEATSGHRVWLFSLERLLGVTSHLIYGRVTVKGACSTVRQHLHLLAVRTGECLSL